MNLLRKFGRQALVLGLDPRLTVSSLRHAPRVLRDRIIFRKQLASSEFGRDFKWGAPYFFFDDADDGAGTARGHYFHQDLLVARAIFAAKPKRHVDVGSSIYGFVSHVASFREIEVIDVRPLNSVIPGMRFVQMDITDTSRVPEGICDSVSCLHAAEHFGLGRYGDKVDADGWYAGIQSLSRMLQPRGTLYFSVPTSQRQRVEFNAHRVFSVPFLESVLKKYFDVNEVSFVDDDGELLRDCDLSDPRFRNAFDCDYGCSIWTLTKK